MGRRKEYISNLTLTRSKLYDMKKAQYYIRTDGFKKLDKGTLIDHLDLYASILSYAFYLPTPATLAAAVIASMGNVILEEKNMIINSSIVGEDYLQELEYFFDAHPEVDQIKVDLSFLEFVDEGYRIVQAKGAITAIHVKSGWIIS
jgi:hypothetical protein